MDPPPPWGNFTVYHLFAFVCEITLPQAVTCRLSLKKWEKHLEILTRTKLQELSTRTCLKKRRRKHSELKQPRQMLNKTKTHTTIPYRRRPKKKPLNEPLKLQRSPMKNHSEKNRAVQNALRRRVLIEECPAKRSKKKHSQNTDKWHLRKAGSFSYGELPWTPPLEGTSLHRWNNSVERPWGILSLFTTCLHLCVKSHCHGLLHVDYPWKSERNTRKC